MNLIEGNATQLAACRKDTKNRETRCDVRAVHLMGAELTGASSSDPPGTFLGVMTVGY